MNDSEEIKSYLAKGCGGCSLYATSRCYVVLRSGVARELRGLLLALGLVEEFKWAHPTYTFNGKLVAMLRGLSHYVGLTLFDGKSLPDPAKLMKPDPTQGVFAREIQVVDFQQVIRNAENIRNLVREAIRR